jgi:hypothetical protein
MIVPVDGGHYRFKYKNDESCFIIGIFHSSIENEASFNVDLYEPALTPAALVPAHLASLLGLPDLKRCEERSRAVSVSDIIITDKLYICFNSIFLSRKVQFRQGMTNLFRVNDDEDDQYQSFIGIDIDHPLRYINEEKEYLSFKMLLVKVRKSYNVFYIIIDFCFTIYLISSITGRILTKH